MTKEKLLDLLNSVREGRLTPSDAVHLLKRAPFDDIGIAKTDNHRELRQGVPEIIYGEGKAASDIVAIVKHMRACGEKTILVTRLNKEKVEVLRSQVNGVEWDGLSRIAVVGGMPPKSGRGYVCVVTGGTSDIPVAEEAVRTLEGLGNEVVKIYDAGVAGLERLLSHLDEILKARVVIAIAGMEGALASVVGGLVDVPVIAVPTSVGYGAAFEGLASLLSMINSCASGVSVVNIDNGFGAGFLASRINHME